MLIRLLTKDVEPFGDLSVMLSPRLNVLVGDNGLGKTFLLDLAWWAGTGGDWAERTVIPRRTPGAAPYIGQETHHWRKGAYFDFEIQQWRGLEGTVFRPLVVRASAESGFDVWDPFRRTEERLRGSPSDISGVLPHRFELGTRAVWDGLVGANGATLCNGLIRDWLTWQFQHPEVFETFKTVLAGLSPERDRPMKPGKPQRVSIEDVRDIPTLELPYATVPVTHASAGMRRILALAYVLVWTWTEHVKAAQLRNTAPATSLLLVIDEIEAHLHPQWQRAILPALFDVVRAMAPEIAVQVFVSTHSPLVLASAEPFFDPSRDQVLHFGLLENELRVEKLEWAPQGDADSWLVSETFGLTQARSREAERAIEAAEAFMRGAPTPADLSTRDEIHAELQRVVPAHDPFWPRWLVGTGAVK